MKCLNPNSTRCECITCTEEQIVISGARARVWFNNYKNPLAQWLCSDEWTTPPNTFPARGMSETNGMHTAHLSGETVGEIPWKKYDILLGKWR